MENSDSMPRESESEGNHGVQGDHKDDISWSSSGKEDPQPFVAHGRMLHVGGQLAAELVLVEEQVN